MMYEYIKYAIAGLSLVISMAFAWRSFYGMRIGDFEKPADKPADKVVEKAAEKKSDDKSDD